MIKRRMELPGVGGRGARELVFNEDSVSVFQDEKSSADGWG